VRWIIIALVLGACRSERPDAQDAGRSEASTASLDAGWVLTGERLEAWIRWQKTVVRLRRQPGASSKQRTLGEATARLDAGLSVEEVMRIEDAIADVMTEHGLFNEANDGAVRAQLLSALEALRDAGHPRLAATIDELEDEVSAGDAGPATGPRAQAAKLISARQAEIAALWAEAVEAPPAKARAK
jgi:hypothetical protein